MKQKDIAAELGITQSAVSSTFRRARRKLDAYDLSKDNTPDDIVWKLWQIFMRDFELPDFFDVEIEFVVRNIFGDILPFINWFYSIGELCRYILRYYLFDEDKINQDIEKYLSAATDTEKTTFRI
ncbi:MAG: sigma-70 region 4 domain-containing protein [Clostridia bacterium]|nr:sigma-70 region 4 domain-containing protein [Clostridia bacterium]